MAWTMKKKFFLRVSFREQGLDRAQADLLAGKHRHDVLEEAIRALELDPADDSVGRGGFPNVLGKMELDAAFMDGDTRNLGAVAGVENFLPVSIARRLMQSQVHTLLIGAGAEIFARECGLQPEPVLTDHQRQEWERHVKPLLDRQPLYEIVKKLANLDENNFDTTIMIAHDGNGMSAAASTAGWPYKYPGRVGDTPVIGAGMYVDSGYGACACTHTGEMSMRAGTARLVVQHLSNGKSARDAVQTAVEDLSSLQAGVLRTLVIHAIDREGDAYVLAVNAEQPVHYYYWIEDLPKPGAASPPTSSSTTTSGCTKPWVTAPRARSSRKRCSLPSFGAGEKPLVLIA
jgi:beta-aspartyl-peptidase (threonine type)